jgi:hypothetical protein
MSFFDLPHIFVVFQPGCGGNFVAGLCHKLINSQLDSIAVSSTGSSHTLADKKTQGTDFLSFTTMTHQHARFSSDVERISYYVENIKTAYSHVIEPMVAWTHDFTNIPIYRKYFKNSRILVITNFSDSERLTAMIMHSHKTFLDKHAIIPAEQHQWDNSIDNWATHAGMILVKLLATEPDRTIPRRQARMILADRFNPAYKDLLTFATIKIFVKHFQSPGLIDDTLEEKLGTYNNVLYPSNDQDLRYKVGPAIETFIDDESVVLPYSYLANNDIALLICTMAAILNRELTFEESSFITESFTKYRLAQDQALLADPAKYFNDLKLTLN